MTTTTTTKAPPPPPQQQARRGVDTVLAIDCSTTVTGWALVEAGELIDFGHFNAREDDKRGDLEARRRCLRRQFIPFIRRVAAWQRPPDIVAFEDPMSMRFATAKPLIGFAYMLQEWVCDAGLGYLWVSPHVWHGRVKAAATDDERAAARREKNGRFVIDMKALARQTCDRLTVNDVGRAGGAGVENGGDRVFADGRVEMCQDEVDAYWIAEAVTALARHVPE